MASPYATELFVKLFGVMPTPPKPEAPRQTPSTSILVPNKPAEPGQRVIIHVTLRNRDARWAVSKEGSTRPSALCDTKDEAVARAKEIALNMTWSQVLVHNMDGKVAQDFSFGQEPGGIMKAPDAPPPSEP